MSRFKKRITFQLLLIALVVSTGLNNYSLAQTNYKISGKVYNTALGDSIGAESITISLSYNNILKYETSTDSNGYYVFENIHLLSDHTYLLESHQVGTLSSFQNLKFGESDPKEYKIDFKMHFTSCFAKPLNFDLYLSGEMFSKNNSTPSDELKDSLITLANKLAENPTIVIKITGHSASNEARTNLIDLSYNRANAAKDLLVENGIEKERILIEGTGCSEPFQMDTDLAELKNGTSLTPDIIDSFHEQESKDLAHQLNRRITITIIRFDYISKN